MASGVVISRVGVILSRVGVILSILIVGLASLLMLGSTLIPVASIPTLIMPPTLIMIPILVMPALLPELGITLSPTVLFLLIGAFRFIFTIILAAKATRSCLLLWLRSRHHGPPVYPLIRVQSLTKAFSMQGGNDMILYVFFLLFVNVRRAAYV